MDYKKVSTLSLINELSRGWRRYFLAAAATMLFAIIFNYLSPQVMRFTVDNVIGSEPVQLPGFITAVLERLGGVGAMKGNLLLCAAGIVVFALLSGIFNYFSLMTIAKGTEGFTKALRNKLFSHIQALPFSWHMKNQTGDIIQRCTSDVETLHEFISKQLYEVVRTVILLAAGLALMYSMNVTLAVVATAFIPIIMLYSTLFHSRISSQFLKADEAEADLTVAAQENLTGVRVVRAFARQGYERDKFEEKLHVFTKKWIDLGYTLGLFWGIGDLATGLQLLSIVCTGAYIAANGNLTLGELLAFISYTQTLAWPVRNLGRTLSELSKAGVSVKRLREILDSPAEPEEPGAQKPPLNRDIAFENVSFSYGDVKVIDNLSFDVKAGSTFGILGATGSGKSTLTALLNRLYDLPVEAGSIKIGGVDLREIDRKYLRRGVGLVLQEPFLFSKTIAENIAIAAPGASLDAIRARAGIADVDYNIMEFRQGYDTVVGERGVTLSGGQKQRVAMARTLMMDCPILIFDDSLSAVDMETDERIRRSLASQAVKGTVILISHRINTLMLADRILVLDEGRAAEIGTHSELAAKGGIYARVYKMQSDAGLMSEKEG